VILILTTRERKHEIMSAVSEKFGIDSEAQGLVFSVPADNIMGVELK
jgi:hypothetical protein